MDENLKTSFQFGFQPKWEQSVLNVRTKLRTRLKSRSPSKNHPTLVLTLFPNRTSTCSWTIIIIFFNIGKLEFKNMKSQISKLLQVPSDEKQASRTLKSKVSSNSKFSWNHRSKFQISSHILEHVIDKHEKIIIYSSENILMERVQKNDLTIFGSLTNPWGGS